MNKQLKQVLTIIALIISAFFAKDYNSKENNTNFKSTNSASLEQVIRKRSSGTIVTIEAKVIKHLSDDLVGDKHQKMIVKVGNNTLLLAHNIDIAPRVPVREGEFLEIKGEYEWNEKGGLIHWTHKSNKNHPPGWIKYNNKKYH